MRREVDAEFAAASPQGALHRHRRLARGVDVQLVRCGCRHAPGGRASLVSGRGRRQIGKRRSAAHSISLGCGARLHRDDCAYPHA